MPKKDDIITALTKLNMLEDETKYFEDINEFDKYADKIDNMEE